jgi:hypothetical protein
MSSHFLGLFRVPRAETLSPIEDKLGIITTVLCYKMQKELNVSIDAKSLSPMLHFGSSVNTAVTLEHFHPGFLEVGRF